MTIAIKIENLSKQYRLGLVSTRTLSHDLNRWWQTAIRGKEDPYLKIGEVNDRATRGDGDYVWALRDINLEVEQGEVLGIIGKNGAGKSTLLKILSKVTAPTTGTIKTKGRIASLLEVGTGFHYEMTGRENIYMNGAIMGMSKAEITRKLDEIIDFAGVERYIDTPVKRYSSGMIVRLGFAVAAHLEPEILVVDEVLAVGDAEFQKKAIGKMQDISHGQGRTVLFVSHNMVSIRNLCAYGLVLNNGAVFIKGDVEKALDKYLSMDECRGNRILDRISKLDSSIIIEEILINGSSKDYINIAGRNVSLEIIIKGSLLQPMILCLEAILMNEDDVPLAIFNPDFTYGILSEIQIGNFEMRRKICLPDRMNKGRYHMDINLVEPLRAHHMLIPKGLIIDCEGFANDSGFVYSMKDVGFINIS